jgi:hypothetical protein
MGGSAPQAMQKGVLHRFAMHGPLRPVQRNALGLGLRGGRSPPYALSSNATPCEACPLVGLALMRLRIRARVAFKPLWTMLVLRAWCIEVDWAPLRKYHDSITGFRDWISSDS